jgi:chemotaxis protein methyltransferase CheR
VTIAPLELRPGEFAEIKRLAYEKFGLDLRSGKEELVSAPWGKVLRKGGFRSFGEYYRHLVGDPSGEALIQLIDALTTNFTSFLREPAHFEFLRQTIVPAWRNRAAIDIWSAACSTGEEPYTLAFSLLEQFRGPSPPAIRILATDISTRALETAERGVYPADRFDGVPAHWLSDYLLRGKAAPRGVQGQTGGAAFDRVPADQPDRAARLFPARSR